MLLYNGLQLLLLLLLYEPYYCQGVPKTVNVYLAYGRYAEITAVIDLVSGARAHFSFRVTRDYRYYGMLANVL